MRTIVALSLPPELAKAVRRRAFQQYRSLSAHVRELIAADLLQAGDRDECAPVPTSREKEVEV